VASRPAPCRGWRASGPGRLPPSPCLLAGVSVETPGSSATSRVRSAGAFRLSWLSCGHSRAWGLEGADTYTQRAIPGSDLLLTWTRPKGCDCVTVRVRYRAAAPHIWEHGTVVIAAQPTVEVVTAGTDWAAIVAAIVTGLAAIIGIAGTAWQAGRARQAATADLKTSIDAATINLRASNRTEDRRAERSEKMRLYSEFQGAIDTALVVAGERNLSEDIAAVYRSAAAVTLIANDDIRTLVGYLAEEIIRGRNALFSSGLVPDKFRNKRDELYELMRADLGTSSTVIDIS
jgi:hypothetical protein